MAKRKRSGLGSIKRSKAKVSAAYSRDRAGTDRVLQFKTIVGRVGSGYEAVSCPASVQTGLRIRRGAMKSAGRAQGNAHARVTRAAARCGVGKGRTPTAAVKSALRSMATRIK